MQPLGGNSLADERRLQGSVARTQRHDGIAVPQPRLEPLGNRVGIVERKLMRFAVEPIATHNQQAQAQSQSEDSGKPERWPGAAPGEGFHTHGQSSTDAPKVDGKQEQPDAIAGNLTLQVRDREGPGQQDQEEQSQKESFHVVLWSLASAIQESCMPRGAGL